MEFETLYEALIYLQVCPSCDKPRRIVFTNGRNDQDVSLTDDLEYIILPDSNKPLSTKQNNEQLQIKYNIIAECSKDSFNSARINESSDQLNFSLVWEEYLIYEEDKGYHLKNSFLLDKASITEIGNKDRYQIQVPIISVVNNKELMLKKIKTHLLLR